MSSFHCPADSTHKFLDYNDFRQHLVKCRLLQDKTAYLCRFSFTHLFLTENLRDLHHLKCPEKEKPPKFSIQTLKLGTKHRDTILSAKFADDDKKKLISNPIKDEKEKNSSLLPLETPFNNENPIDQSLLNNSLPPSFNPNLDPLDPFPSQSNPFPSFDPNPSNIKEIFQRPFNRPSFPTKSSLSPPVSQRLDSLIHTLIFENQQRLDLILRRRSPHRRLQMKEFSISSYEPISLFQHLLNQSFSLDSFENDFFIGEYALFGSSEEKVSLYSSFISRFEAGERVAVNTSYKDTHNEVLLLCTNQTKYLGSFLRKGDLAVLLFKYTALYNKVRIFQGPIGNFQSPWVQSKDPQEQDPMEIVKKERTGGWKKEVGVWGNKDPFHFYSREEEVREEEGKEEEEEEGDQLILLGKKIEELKSLLEKQTDQYKQKLNELEMENQRKRGEIKQYVQMIGLLEAKRNESLNDLNNHDLLYKEDKKQFEIKFNEELMKQKEKYHQVFHHRIKEYDEDLKLKQQEIPLKEQEYQDLLQDYEEKRVLFEKSDRMSQELRNRLINLKKAYEKRALQVNLLEIHTRFPGNEEQDLEGDQDRCHLCLKERRNVVNLPCRHLVACEKCIEKARVQGIEYCLACKKEVKQRKVIKWD